VRQQELSDDTGHQKYCNADISVSNKYPIRYIRICKNKMFCALDIEQNHLVYKNKTVSEMTHNMSGDVKPYSFTHSLTHSVYNKKV